MAIAFWSRLRYYQRSLFENHKYKTPTFVIHSLIDIVSRNGNLLLSIPLRGDGSIATGLQWWESDLEGISNSRVTAETT